MSRDQADDLVAALGQHAGGLVGVGQQITQLRVALIEGLRRTAHPFARRPSDPAGCSAKVSARVPSESDSWSVFRPLIVVARSPSASGS